MLYQIAMVVPGLPFDGRSLETKSLGGSETAAIYMARELAKLGHEVFVFSDCKPGRFDRVVYNHISAIDQFRSIPHDITIIQRAPELYANIWNSKLQVLWCHDLANMRNRESFLGTQWNVDSVFVMSQFHSEQYKQVYGIDESTLFVTRNGIDLSAFELPFAKRNYKQLVYAARPERGLDNLLSDIMPRLISIDPEYQLVLCGYENPVEHFKEFYANCAAAAKQMPNNVRFAGHLNKSDLYSLYSQSGAYVYPTPSRMMPNFDEISCISAMESMAAGLPFITSNRGALPETLAGGASILVDGDPWTKEYIDLFVDAIIDVTSCPNLHSKMADIGMIRANSLDWSGVAEQWDTFFADQIKKNNRSKDRLARHFVRHSDYYAASLASNGASEDIKALIDERSRHLHDRALFHSFHEWSSARMQGNWEDHSGSPRYRVVEDFVRSHPGYKVLDYGCAYGFYTLPLAKAFPERQIVGLDISEFCIAQCRKWQDGKLARFVAANEYSDFNEKFDIVICADTLEHCADYKHLLDRLEKLCNPGGHILLTIPWGPWELDSDVDPIYRIRQRGDISPYGWLSNHLWEFDSHDLNDIFVGKPGLDISAITAGTSKASSEYLGWWVVSYQPDHKPTNRIDVDRKLRLQRPLETLSVNILGGPQCIETLQWCLEPLHSIADEILIADCGISQDPVAMEIASRFGAQVIPAPSPIEHGFETPRNVLLDCSNMDWILWIDTDERLINPHRVKRYLRPNGYNGYSLRQHHKAVDAEFKPDMPVRLFRRAPYKGESMRFYGMIHEHAELGLNKGPGPIIVLSDISILHVGYESEAIRQVRFNRNLPLMIRDREKYPERILGKHFQCRDNLLLAKQRMEINGGKVDQYVMDLCEDTVKLYKETFLGKPDYINIDTAQYYTDALRLLGRGVDIAFGLQATTGNDNSLQGNVMRFETADEAIAELSWRAKQQIEPRTDKYF